MKKTLLSLAVLAVLSGCASHSALKEKITGEQFDAPKIEESKFLKKDANKLRPPEGGPLPVAVYGFRDLTGQRKSQPLIASLSSAVTQGAENYLIKALQDVGDARWFTVLERVGLENLIKERQMIRQMREQYQGRDAKMLPPMMFAGIIMEGGIVGYDSNTLTGGSGVRIFGIGASTQYQSDTVTVTLRTVSVSTGEILTTVTVTKTVLSYMDKLTVLRFVDDGSGSLGAGTNALEGEVGGSINESINKAIDVAVQAAVVNTINEGARKGHWSFKEERKNELVQSQAPAQRAPEVTPAPQQPSKPESTGESKAVETKSEPKQEVKKEEPKNDVKPITAVVPPAPVTTPTEQSEKPKEQPKQELTGTVYLKEMRYIHKEPNENSQKTWQLKKGTEFTVVSTTGEWVQVTNSEKRGGFVKREALTTVKP
jgi:curli production assembly/transport component CsgG